MSDLFDIVAISPSAEYVALRDAPRNSALKARAQQLWRTFEPFADSQFRKEFALHLHPRFWEMYLGAWLVQNEYGLQPRKNREGPDFHIRRDDRSVWLEATAPDEGAGPDAVPSIYEGRGHEPVPEDLMVLRFTNAISQKAARRDQYVRDGVIPAEDPFVIAINGRGIPMTIFDAPLPAIIKSVYPFGQYSITLRVDTLETVRAGYHRRDEVTKKSGSTVATTAFLDPSTAGVSAILYSSAALWDPPPSPGHEFLFIHNSVAVAPLHRGYFHVGKECFFQENGLVITDHNAGA